MIKKIYLSKISKKSFKTSNNFFQSLKYAFEGIVYCFVYTRNFRIQIFCGLLALISGIYFDLNPFEWLLILATIISVLVLELLNTANESIVNLIVDKKFRKLAKIAKDCSAAAVLLTSLNAIFVAVYIFLPKIKILLFNL